MMASALPGRQARFAHFRSINGETKGRCTSFRSRVSVQAASSAPNLRRELARAVRQQAAKQLRLLREELLDPWFEPPPPPLTDTLPPAQLADVDSKFINVHGVRLHYKEAGAAHAPGPAVLLLHGFNGSAFNWRDCMEGISQDTSLGPVGRRVIAFDRPPFGLTERPLQADSDLYSCEGGARLAAGLLDALGVQSAIVVGHSMGAVVGMELLKAQPQRVAGLVLVSPALPPKPDAFRRAMTAGQQLQALARLTLLRSDTAGLNYIRKSLRARAAEVRAGQLDLYHDGRPVGSDVREGFLRPMQAHDWDRGSLLGYRSISFSEQLPAYDSIAQPVLVVHGRQDKTIPASTADSIVEQLRRRRGAITQHADFDNCGHYLMEDSPEEFVAAVRAFLAAAAAAPSASRAASQLVPVADTSPAVSTGVANAEVV